MRKKTIAILLAIVTIIYIIVGAFLFLNIGHLWLVIIIFPIWRTLIGMQVTAAYSLTLEQISQFRETIMSMNSTASNLGVALGAGIGGTIVIFAVLLQFYNLYSSEKKTA